MVVAVPWPCEWVLMVAVTLPVGLQGNGNYNFASSTGATIPAGGTLLAGFTNPVAFLFDPDLLRQGKAELRWAVPYSDLHSLTDEERRRYTDVLDPLVFGHSLEDQMGGQLDAGFLLTGMYEDRGNNEDERALHERIPCYIATRALRPAQ